ncbi:MAG TPA: flavoprotein [Lacipirellulaceae bacterium]|jgi:phosphopantothenoylcysteine decarboxylase/phosphopantothenate--cysteine ligase|nr:flavoprotein [Lacipirellulaceae bacterium]
MAQELIIGVSGGIAAYKTAALVSSLVQHGHGVSVVMTRSARRFIGPATFRALTGRPVACGGFDRHYPLGAHIELADKADLLCIAPASANVLAKAACGLADDLLSTLLLSFTGPTIFAPAMNSAMWEKPSVQRNIKTLRGDGIHFVDPQAGWQSCRRQGMGRLADPADIEAAIERALAAKK